MGHEGYLATYRRYPEDEIREAYANHAHVLSVTVGDEELARQVAEQQTAMEIMQEENVTLRQEMAAIKADLLEVQVVRAMLANRDMLNGGSD